MFFFFMWKMEACMWKWSCRRPNSFKSCKRTYNLYVKMPSRTKCPLGSLSSCPVWIQCSDRPLQSTEGQCWDAASRQLLRFPVAHILVTKRFVTGAVSDRNTVQCADWAHPRLWSYVLVKLRSQTQADTLDFSVCLLIMGEMLTYRIFFHSGLK